MDGYFPGNSSRGRLEGFEAWSTRVGLLQLPANSVDVIRQQFQQHSRHIVGSRVSRNVPTRRHISGDASRVAQPRASLSYSRFVLVSVPSLSPCCLAFHALIGLRSLRLNITEFCSFNSRSIVSACARGSEKDERRKFRRKTTRRQTVTRTKSLGKRASHFERSSKQLERDKELQMKSILISTARRHNARNELPSFRRDLNPLIYIKWVI